MKTPLTIVMLLFSLISFSQESDCDTLSQSISNILSKFSKNKTEVNIQRHEMFKDKISEECTMAQVYIRMVNSRINIDTGNIQLALMQLDEALVYANKTDNNSVKKDIIKLASNVHYNKGEFLEAKNMADEGIKIPCHADSTICLETNIKLLLNKGVYLTKLNDFDGAIQIYDKADSLIAAYNLKDPMYRVMINNSLGVIARTQLEDTELSLEYFKKAFIYCPTNHRSKVSLATNIATISRDIGAIDSTKFYLNYVINSTDLPSQLISPYQVLGLIEIKINNFDAALSNFEKALEYAQKSGIEEKIIKCKIFMGRSYFHLEKYAEAGLLLNEVNQFYQENPPQKTTLMEFERYFYLNKVALNNPNNSKDIHQYLINYDSLYGDERQNKLNKLIYKYENKIVNDSLAAIKLVAENQSLTLKNQKLNIFSLVSALFASFLAILFFFRRLKKSKVENNELVFENNELKNINKQLEHKTKALSTNVQENEIPTELQIKSNDKIFMIPMDNITHIQAEDEGTRIHYDETSKWTDSPLKEMRNQVPNTLFIQVFRSTLVNIKHIGWINSTTLKLKDDTVLKIGRTYKQKIKDILEN